MTVLEKSDPRAPVQRKGWKTTGWQGLTMQVPPEWNLVAYGGDSKTGNLRLDNGDPGTNSALGIEMRWSPIKGKITETDLDKRLIHYFTEITKSAKRQKIATETKSKPLVDSRYPDRDVGRSFTWRADRRAVGRIWHCTECGRLVIAQVIGGTRGDFTGVATDILASIACHSADGNWQTWSLYDLLTEVPADYALKGQPQLMNIYVQLAFQRGQTLDSLTVEQWGVANVQLRGAYLDEWFRQKNSAIEPLLTYEATEAEAQGHPALALTGRRTGIQFWATQGIAQVGKLQMPATHFVACIWECPESNKIHLVQSFSRRPQPELVREIVERTQCHY